MTGVGQYTPRVNKGNKINGNENNHIENNINNDDVSINNDSEDEYHFIPSIVARPEIVIEGIKYVHMYVNIDIYIRVCIHVLRIYRSIFIDLYYFVPSIVGRYKFFIEII
jgi:hypothetical protein